MAAVMSDAPPVSSEKRNDHSDTTAFWLRRGDQLFVGTLVALGIGLLALSWIRLTTWGAPLVEIERLPSRQYDYQLDINRATWIEWTLLEGIGEKLAQRIVTYREEHGPFTVVDDLSNVPGIGPKTLDRIRPWLVVNTADRQAN